MAYHSGNVGISLTTGCPKKITQYDELTTINVYIGCLHILVLIDVKLITII